MPVKKGHRFGARNTITLTEEERSVVVGTLLGDSSISWGTGDRVSARIRVRNCLAQRDLVQWKYDQLRRLVRTPPRETPNRGYRQDGVAIGFSTRCFGGDLLKIKQEVSPGKTITTGFLGMLTHPIGLAAWFMDDGSRSRGASLVLHTQSMTEEELSQVVRWLMVTWGVKATIASVKNRRYKVLRIPAESGERFMNLVRPYVSGITSMEHKIMLPRESLFCPMCGTKFTATRRQLSEHKRIVTCRAKACLSALSLLTARINDGKVRDTSTT